MSLRALREEVFEANQDLVRHGLVIFTWGNASGFDRSSGKIAIKPSGVPYATMTPDHLVVTDLDGRTIEGNLRPSSDLPTHLGLYRTFDGVNGIVHTHSRYATAWAQAGVEIPMLGTTHADYFRTAIPLTDPMTPAEIEFEYEKNTAEVIMRRFAALDPLDTPAVLVAGHGPFVWGTSASDAAHNSVVLEELARIAHLTLSIKADAEEISQALRDKHFLRKHGPAAYYGQNDL